MDLVFVISLKNKANLRFPYFWHVFSFFLLAIGIQPQSYLRHALASPGASSRVVSWWYFCLGFEVRGSLGRGNNETVWFLLKSHAQLTLALKRAKSNVRRSARYDSATGVWGKPTGNPVCRRHSCAWVMTKGNFILKSEDGCLEWERFSWGFSHRIQWNTSGPLPQISVAFVL